VLSSNQPVKDFNSKDDPAKQRNVYRPAIRVVSCNIISVDCMYIQPCIKSVALNWLYASKIHTEFLSRPGPSPVLIARLFATHVNHRNIHISSYYRPSREREREIRSRTALIIVLPSTGFILRVNSHPNHPNPAFKMATAVGEYLLHGIRLTCRSPSQPLRNPATCEA
jgi:hypothetical protein